MLPGMDIPPGGITQENLGKMYENRAKPQDFNAGDALNKIKLQQVLNDLTGGNQQNVPGALAGAVDGSEMPHPIPEIPTIPPVTDGRPQQFQQVTEGKDEYGRPVTKNIETPEFDLWKTEQKANIAEKARGIDPMYKKQVEIFKDVLKHRTELEGLLFQGDQWQPGVKVHSPTNWKAQRFSELLKEAETAQKLLSARNVQGESTGFAPKTGMFGQGVGMFTNPTALKKNLEDLYSTIGAATENIQPGATAQAPAQGNTFATEQEALASGIKGEVIIGGRRARID
jgi:hypothetical protein